jgi:hypothetical protein
MLKKVYLLKKNVRKKENCRKKRVKQESRSYFRSSQKYECHSHIAPFDKKEWHSSFAPYFGSGAQEWHSKECRSLTHCIFVTKLFSFSWDLLLVAFSVTYLPIS